MQRDVLRDLQNLLTTIFVLCIAAFGYLALHDLDLQWLKSTPVAIANSKYSSAKAASNLDNFDRVENGIHVETGLVYAEGFDIVRATCTACHSAKLVTQNRATKEGWRQMIRWMQETQGLWDLGRNESKILDYLATHYAPEATGRRQNLDVAAIEWYILELE